MTHRTRFTELVGCAHPVQLAAMGGGVGGTALAAAVQEAGGQGMVSWTEEPGASGCGVNFLVPFLPAPDEILAIARRVRVVEFFYGDPDAALVEVGHRAGAVVGWQVGSAYEAEAAAAARCDYVVAQGTEAGGHVRGSDSLDVVLREVLDRVSLPVVAAGGIATGERVHQLIAAGADGVRVGTRFLTCPESGAHEQYVENLLSASGEDTVLTGWFDLGWPQAPHRVLRAALVTAERAGWKSPLPPGRGEAGPIAGMAQYAGAGVGAVTTVQPAADVVADLVSRLVE